MVILTNCEAAYGVDAAVKALLETGSGLDAIEQGIRPVEADVRVDSVGRGGSPNLLGEMECDAAMMDGTTLMAGSVGALKDYLHAISVARAVMTRLPHVMLVGEGAHRFAAEMGAEKAEMLTDEARQRHGRWLREHVPPGVLAKWPDVPLAPFAWESGKEYGAGGTVVYLVRDAKGNISAGTSTSGWAQSYPGRLGDSPIIGAGLYADSHYGAAACTHTGEMTVRCSTAHSVVLYMRKGASVQEACHEAMDDLLALQGGQIGAVVVHGMDFYGNICVLTSHDVGEKASYYHWRDDTGAIEHRQAEVVKRAL
jgi:L-asparaginase / beta-aspartyl-peptidase